MNSRSLEDLLDSSVIVVHPKKIVIDNKELITFILISLKLIKTLLLIQGFLVNRKGHLKTKPSLSEPKIFTLSFSIRTVSTYSAAILRSLIFEL